MKFTLLITVILMMQSTLLLAQNRDLVLDRDFKYCFDSTRHEDILIGEVNDKILTFYKKFNWYTDGIATYQPDTTRIHKIKTYLQDYKVYIFLGTWCDDTKYLLPKLMKVLELAEFPKENITFFAMDGKKKAINMEKEIFEIEKLPTFIFYKKNVEQHRIIESIGSKSIEQYLFDFLFNLEE